MKKKLCLAIFFIFFLFSINSAASEFQIKNAGFWPGFDNPKAIAFDNDRGLVFWGTGDIIGIYDSSLAFKGYVRVNTKNGIKGISYDPVEKNLYVAAGRAGFYIIDTSDYESPFIKSEITESSENNPGYVMGKAIREINACAVKFDADRKYVYMADNNFGLRIINVLDSRAPFELASYRQDSPYESDTTGGYVNLDSCSANGKTYLFILDSFYGLRVFDATLSQSSDGSSVKIPEPVSKDLRDFYYNSMSLVKDIRAAVYGNKLYAFVSGPNTESTQAAVVKYEISFSSDTSASLTTDVSEIKNVGRCDTLTMARSFALKDRYAFVADNDKGIQVVDIINPVSTNQSGIESYAVKANYSENVSGAYSVFINGNTLYLADFKTGLRKFDISNPEALIVSGNPAISPVHGISLDVAEFVPKNQTQKHVFSFMLSDSDAPALYIFDTTAPGSISLEAVAELPSKPSKIKIYGNYAFIAAGDGGLITINISDPGLPGIPVKTDTPGFAHDVAIKNYDSKEFAFIADGFSGLAVIAVSDAIKSGNSIPVTSFPVSGVDIKGIDIKNDYAVFAAGEYGIMTANIANPGAPVMSVSHVDTAGDAVAVQVDGNYAYVADGPSGLQIIDITDPSFPGVPVQTSVNGNSTGVSVSGGYAHVSKGANGYSVIDISKPEYSSVISSYSTCSGAMGIKFFKDYTYIADSSGALHISKFSVKTIDPVAPLIPSKDDSACFIKSISFDLREMAKKVRMSVLTFME